MDQDRLVTVLESILFASEHPVGPARLKEVFGEEGPGEDEFNQAFEQIQQRYQEDAFGFELRRAGSGFHFVTKPANVEFVQRFLATKPFRLSRSAMEVMAIVAYRQPITRAEIDHVRGIDSSHVLRVLMDHGLVKMAGKAEVPGRPVQYASTPKFLDTVGLNTLNDLPPLSELEQIQGDTQRPEDNLENDLEQFIDATGVREQREQENQEELQEITDLIKNAYQSDKEVYASPLHQEVGESNRESLAAFQANNRRRKKTGVVKYEDLVGSAEAGTSSEDPRPMTELEAEIYGPPVPLQRIQAELPLEQAEPTEFVEESSVDELTEPEIESAVESEPTAKLETPVQAELPVEPEPSVEAETSIPEETSETEELPPGTN